MSRVQMRELKALPLGEKLQWVANHDPGAADFMAVFNAIVNARIARIMGNKRRRTDQ